MATTTVATASDVRRYYDRNTWKFLISGRQRAIHRELWGPGVTSAAQAVHHAHALVLAALHPDDRRVLDLGCGVGAAGRYLAQRRPVDVVGVTISPAQVRLAGRDPALGGPGRTRVMVGDFTALPNDLGLFDAAFAIESFVHADPADAFFAEAARSLRLGGTLLVIDDVRTGPAADPRLSDVRTDWKAATLLTVDEAAALAAGHGFRLVQDRDLSALQRLGRPRDRLIRLAQPLLRRLRGRSAWAQSLVGGDALQRCHRDGLLEYHLLQWERQPNTTSREVVRVMAT